MRRPLNIAPHVEPIRVSLKLVNLEAWQVVDSLSHFLVPLVEKLVSSEVGENLPAIVLLNTVNLVQAALIEVRVEQFVLVSASMTVVLLWIDAGQPLTDHELDDG